MFKFNYRNTEGAIITMGVERPFVITSSDGLDAVTNNITTLTQFNMAGVDVVGQQLASRTIKLDGEVVATSSSELENLRSQFISIMNPDLAGSLEVETNNKTYSIDVLVDVAPNFGTSQKANEYEFTVELLAAQPYFYDVTDYNKLIPLSFIQNKMKFPLQITSNYIFASIVSGAITTVTNSGDIKTGAVFTTRVSGEATNIKILNIATNEYFLINDSFVAGDVITLNTLRGHLQVYKTDANGTKTNLMSKRDVNSDFFELIKGDNFIQITAATGETVITTDMQFTPLVLGV
ncbi:tail protein [Flyfo myovirus Tbat2_7]|nr:tail protein [Flyfo myovirus Tbat2_7]